MSATDTPAPAVGAQVERPVGRLAPERDDGGTTYRWLVESFTTEGQSTGLYMACQANMTLTADVNAARKFRLQRTAEFRALDMREARRGDWRAVEHGFEEKPPEFECLGEPSLCTNPRGCACAPDPTLKPDIAALKKRLAEDPGFAAEVTGDKPPTPGCHTPEGCRENGCLGWCDEHKPEGPKP